MTHRRWPLRAAGATLQALPIREPAVSDALLRSRRAFILESAIIGLVAAGFPRALAAQLARRGAAGTPVRVRGRVTGGGRGLARVAVSDGATVVTTDAAGYFELVTGADRGFVSVSLPAGYQLPVQPNGTVRHFVPLQPDLRGEQRVQFALEPIPGGDERHAFVLCADPQTQDAFEMRRLHEETVPDLAATRQALGDVPVFGVGCGDLMYDDLSLYPEFERALRATGIPFFAVVGNHDLDQDTRTDEASTGTFERHFGPAWYSFNRGRVHYVVLDDVFWHGDGYIGYLGALQLEWLRQDLALVPPGSTVVVCLHIPSSSTRPARTGETQERTGEMVTNRAALHRLLEPFTAHLLAGHTHEHEHIRTGGVTEHVHGTVCGAWWSGDICWDGTPNGYAVYEVDGEALRWRYKGTGLPAETQLRLYPAGAEPTAPGDIVANVWDWDPSWQVVWYEGADRRGPMSRRRGLDPRARAEQAGRDKPARRSWVEPVPTDHLFYAPAAGAREVRVEATDAHGRRYVERLADS